MKNRLTLLFSLLGYALLAQNSFTIQKNIAWPAEPLRRVSPANGQEVEIWEFEGSAHSAQFRSLPVFVERFRLEGRSRLTVELTSAQWEAFPQKKAAPDDRFLVAEPKPEASLQQVREEFFGFVRFVPVRRRGSSFERATAITLTVRVEPDPLPTGAADRGGPHTYNSVLSDGEVFKFGVAKSGIYKLDFNFLKNDLKISNLESIDPRTIKLYGNGGAMLPEKNDTDRPDDLLENAIQIVGEEDGKFDAGDFILFYAVGPEPWIYRPSTTDPEITVRRHLYDTHAYYFLKISAGNGIRIAEQNSVDAGSGQVSDSFDDYRRFEEDKVNLLDLNPSTQGSGKRFFGDYFYQTKDKDYSSQFDFGNGVINDDNSARFRAEFAGRCGTVTNVNLVIDGKQFSKNVPAVDVTDNEASYAANALLSGTFKPAGNKIAVKLDYPLASEQREGWLDYIEINVRRQLDLKSDVLEFRDIRSLANDVTAFKLAGANNDVTIWDLTQPQSVKKQKFELQNGAATWGAATKGALKNYIAFKSGADFGKPEKTIGKIANQNLHGLDNLHFALIYHADFKDAAERLAAHRRDYSKLDVAIVDVEQLYNEFSSGAKDPTAVRDFAKMLYERNPKFDYLLLFGDGSFDPRNNTQSDDNRDFVPIFETFESFSPITAHPADDYFGLLTNGEGGALDGGLDIAVGRIPCNTADEAEAVVEKIIAYDNTAPTLGDWHLRLLYIADDEDGNVHLAQADKLALAAENTEKWFNTEKIYFDAYQQVATSAGQRYPDAKAAVNSNIFKGALIAQYIGHGGPRGWAQERVIDNGDIAGWDNLNRYPFIITATCTFGGYDDPFTVSGGEQALLKTRSGAVGLFTTVRPVYIEGNNRLTDAIQQVIFRRVNGQYRSVGDILKDGKNLLTSVNEDNARRFTLLGDPAMYLALPEYRVATTKINGRPVGQGTPDTLRALSAASIEGIVTDTLGNSLSNFNGRVFVTVFDKKQTLSTLGQDPKSPVQAFVVRRNTLFKGSATVTNGNFKIEFIVPKDIDYGFGTGKISYYAENGSPLDAAGANTDFYVGGNANQIQDDTPPLVQVFMNTDAFATGGITDADPKILVKCSDDYGMNVTGSSLGHDLVAVLDDNVQESIVLNDFFESEQDNYRKGRALYPLKNLEPGRHKIRVKGWDIANNSGEGYTEFVVAEDGKAALDHVLNYPNPFTTNTLFQFEHNLAGQVLDTQISIFTVGGRLVKTLLHSAPADGYRVTDIAWDGKDEYGDQLAKGVYLYRVKVRGTSVEGSAVTAESDFEKLVILK